MAKPKPTMPSSDADFFVLRTPLLPLSEWTRWSDGLTAAHAAGDRAALAAALAHDRAQLRQRLAAAIARPEIAHALFVASPSLADSLPEWLRDPDGERGQKVERALVRYFSRMAARATPFGLFAGWSTGRVDAHTELALPPRAEYRRATRLDMDYLYELSERLSREPSLRAAQRYWPNPMAYCAAGRVRYPESSVNGRTRDYKLVGVDTSPFLDAAMGRARNGATRAELTDAVVAVQAGVARADAEAFVDQLIDGQLVVSELTPRVTGDDPLAGLIDQLAAFAEAEPWRQRLVRARDQLAALDAGAGAGAGDYQRVAAELEPLPAPVTLARLFQIDMYKPAPALRLGRAVVDELAAAVELLARLAPRGTDALARFREEFAARYELREVPLLEALDEEVGVGFATSNAPTADGSPLLAGLRFAGNGDGDASIPFTTRHERLLAAVEEVQRAGAAELLLDDALVAELSRPQPAPLPGAYSVLATLVASSAEAIDAGRFRVMVDAVAGPSGARLLGRFCHADDELRERVRDHVRAEEALRPDAVFAEIVHLPEGRVGNVLLRPLLRGHEIALLGRSSSPSQLALDDLTVAVRGSRVVLRSRSLGCEVLPRLTTAHNYSYRSIGVYRFLCSLQTQGVTSALRFDWGPLARLAWLPRVVRGRVILARARWLLRRRQLEALTEPGDAVERFAAAQALRGSLRLPRHISFEEGDHVLPLDLDNPLSLEAFVQLARGRAAVTLTEWLADEDELCAHGPEGGFTNELVVPFVRRRTPAVDIATPAVAPAAAVVAAAPSTEPTRRLFGPGSPWLYAKLYCGTAGADRVLRDLVAPLIARARASGAIDGFFFVRYGDPQWHLRVRLHGDPARLRGEVQPQLEELAQRQIDAGVVRKLQLDSYEREIERYGGPDGVQLAEALFQADSETSLALVMSLPGDAGADARWRLALYGADRLLDELGIELAARASLVEQWRDGLGRDLGADAGCERQLGERFRGERLALEALLDAAQPVAGALALGRRLYDVRRQRQAGAIEALRAAAAAGRLSVPLPQLASSYVHMNVNRLLRSAQRAHELVLLDFLSRLYRGRLARQRGRAAASATTARPGALP